uniref:Putative VRR-NUC domain-containing protein n=1 Tax=viral metagenome TaxID=1070528 RepID=A0A6M3LK80_9ZZZZ
MKNKEGKLSYLKPKLSETDIKRQVIEYLNIHHIFNYGLLQGIGSYRGAPDRVLFFKGEVIFLELKTEKGKLSQYQEEFQRQCANDGIKYYVVRSLEDLRAIVDREIKL